MPPTTPEPPEPDVKWLAMVLRQAFLLVTREVERRYQITPSCPRCTAQEALQRQPRR
jgi:hypothetical protein